MTQAAHGTADAETLARNRWRRLASPAAVYGLAGRLLPWFWVAASLFGLAGLAVGLLIAPTDFQQGDAYRIVFIHAPATWMSMVNFVSMAFWAVIGLASTTRLAMMMAAALAPTGALMSFIALWTGALWGKPIWDAWLLWDEELAAELLLLSLYIGYLALRAAINDPQRADRAGAVLALVGVVQVPTIYFSLQGWAGSHEGAAASILQVLSSADDMFTATLLITLAFWAWAIGAALHRVRSIILERERVAGWIRQLPEVHA